MSLLLRKASTGSGKMLHEMIRVGSAAVRLYGAWLPECTIWGTLGPG